MEGVRKDTGEAEKEASQAPDDGNGSQTTPQTGFGGGWLAPTLKPAFGQSAFQIQSSDASNLPTQKGMFVFKTGDVPSFGSGSLGLKKSQSSSNTPANTTQSGTDPLKTPLTAGAMFTLANNMSLASENASGNSSTSPFWRFRVENALASESQLTKEMAESDAFTEGRGAAAGIKAVPSRSVFANSQSSLPAFASPIIPAFAKRARTEVMDTEPTAAFRLAPTAFGSFCSLETTGKSFMTFNSNETGKGKSAKPSKDAAPSSSKSLQGRKRTRSMADEGRMQETFDGVLSSEPSLNISASSPASRQAPQESDISTTTPTRLLRVGSAPPESSSETYNPFRALKDLHTTESYSGSAVQPAFSLRSNLTSSTVANKDVSTASQIAPSPPAPTSLESSTTSSSQVPTQPSSLLRTAQPKPTTVSTPSASGASSGSAPSASNSNESGGNGGSSTPMAADPVATGAAITVTTAGNQGGTTGATGQAGSMLPPSSTAPLRPFAAPPSGAFISWDVPRTHSGKLLPVPVDQLPIPNPSSSLPELSALLGRYTAYYQPGTDGEPIRSTPLRIAWKKMDDSQRRAYKLWYNLEPSAENITPFYKSAYNWASCRIEDPGHLPKKVKSKDLRSLEAFRRIFKDQAKVINIGNLVWLKFFENCKGSALPLYELVLAAAHVVDAEKKCVKAVTTGRIILVNLDTDGKEREVSVDESSDELPDHIREVQKRRKKITTALKTVISRAEEVKENSANVMAKVDEHLEILRGCLPVIAPPNDSNSSTTSSRTGPVVLHGARRTITVSLPQSTGASRSSTSGADPSPSTASISRVQGDNTRLIASGSAAGSAAGSGTASQSTASTSQRANTSDASAASQKTPTAPASNIASGASRRSASTSISNASEAQTKRRDHAPEPVSASQRAGGSGIRSSSSSAPVNAPRRPALMPSPPRVTQRTIVSYRDYDRDHDRDHTSRRSSSPYRHSHRDYDQGESYRDRHHTSRRSSSPYNDSSYRDSVRDDYRSRDAYHDERRQSEIERRERDERCERDERRERNRELRIRESIRDGKRWADRDDGYGGEEKRRRRD